MKAETLFARRQFREAAETYNAIDAALVSDANRPGLLFQRGWCLATAGDYQGAIRSLTKFIAEYPNDPRLPEALAKRADAALENDDRGAALRDLDQLISLNPNPTLAGFAWQTSARLCKDQGQLDEMIRRYQALIEKVPKLETEIVANANYWIGWGHFKGDRLAEALPWLRKARELEPKTYGSQAGLVLTLALFSLQDVDGLAAEIKLAIDGNYADQVPEQSLRWIGTQVYNAGRYDDAARFLGLVATPDEPRQTPKVVWRYLGKAQLETGKAADALIAIEHVLEVEDQDVWKADALLDKSRALLALGRAQEALDTGNAALALRPQGRIGSGLRLAVGDAGLALNNLDEAIKHYVYVVELVDDRELRPQALEKLVVALDRKGDPTDAARYRKILHDEFPDRQPAARPAPAPAPAPR
jgi:tetratricopeptide (TPR) repeat protein